ncbi:TPA: apolipoprotein N-acyltransferase [Legionella pneumophila]|uniref:apolipoprotein N-acyltransferase n=1 Tax=Legionella pneumophila TaxID=446 RepID=UPI001A22F110|nr:apolipoprotein N-acyltransferase [Legionella pneumophila]HAT9535289.1 apolipoprotein N-acyltransferase [Legionella pneumophila subsp. pneumophila]MDW9028038.1 apolipoprotein N-acyltransferase [Legionella pneumophila]MDW9070342.1 apolipoprotein N-acyltransferase [Legionella pneumophila]MDW9091851.1 apolipoprotein N-acyltransferase [Legionella pneumophila]MDW9094754.1 apolipoprotein N-acyltransferase [Legionella pneumophila]
MKQAALIHSTIIHTSTLNQYSKFVVVFLAGLLAPLGFAPFHLPGLTILSLAILFSEFLQCTVKQGFTLGFLYGLGYFGFGVSWVIISIHDYGQLDYFLAGVITLLFIMYLSLFPGIVGYSFKLLSPKCNLLTCMFLFSTLWCMSELIRSKLFTGFPWLLTGITQIDTPLRYIAPVVGVYGLGLICSFLGALLVLIIKDNTIKRYYYLSVFILILIAPSLGKNIHWTEIKKEPISVGAIQPNLSMRDKWDETLFWNLLKYYENKTDKLLGKNLIVLPESAIPLPASYVEDYLQKLHEKALKAKSSLILGILQPTDNDETNFYNSIISLGEATGAYVKRQLVPFGEYIPKPFIPINRWLNLPEPNVVPGRSNQPLINIANHPIASLICYEIAYPNILRAQMPAAQWIVSISDNGWFGHSLASYQQLQMAQMLSLLTGRYQILVNNDGLSSVINHQGTIVEGLPAFNSGILQTDIFPANGITPWIIWSDYPAFIFCFIFVLFVLFFNIKRFTEK